MQKRRQVRGQSMSATRRLVLSAVFAALAYAVMLVFRVNVQFLTFDLKDAVITVAGLLLGPVAALSISVLVAVLEFITVGDTGVYGLIMNMASSVTFSVTAAVVYKYRKRLSGAIAGLGLAVPTLVGVMLLLNLLVTPYYMGVTRGAVAELIPTLLLPFNAAKALTNASLVLIFYKPISRAMAVTGLLPRGGRTAPAEGDAKPTDRRARRVWVSIAVTVVGVHLLAAALLYIWFGLGGRPAWFEPIRGIVEKLKGIFP